MTAKPVSWVRYSGDVDAVTITLTGISVLLGTANVVATLWSTDTDAATITGSVTDAANKRVTIPLQAWLANRKPDRYNLKVRIDGVTWPEEGEVYIDVVKTPVPVP